MPTTLSFSTAAPFGGNNSTVFGTPAAQLDGNNNISGSSKGDNRAGEMLNESRSPFSGVTGDSGIRSQGSGSMICDDCGNHGILARWCASCSSAICDACILDRHMGNHELMLYQEAVREADKLLNEALLKAACNVKQFAANRARADRFRREIETKVHEMKRKVEKRAVESVDLAKAMSHQLDELTLLADKPLNAKAAVDRSHASATSKTSIGDLSKRQGAIVGQLKRIVVAVAGMDEGIGTGNENEDLWMTEEAE